MIDAQALPVPEGIDPNSIERPYRIGANDELLVDIAGFPTLDDRKIRTDGDGRISVPIAGEIEARGMTISELEQAVTQRLRERYVRDPVVSINLSEALSQAVTVDGQVVQPGVYPVVGRSTLMQSVARARGLTEFAKQDDVVIFRTIGTQRYVALYNLAAVRRGAYPDPEIFSGDTIVVGESSSRRLFQTILAASPLFITPIVALLQNNNN